MIGITPTTAIKILSGDGSNSYLATHKAKMKKALSYAKYMAMALHPEEEKSIPYVQLFLKQVTELDIPEKRLKSILVLYPIELSAINLTEVVAHSSIDSEAETLLLNIIANFFLGTYWPVNKDQVDFQEWIRTLHSAYDYLEMSDHLSLWK